MNQYTAFIGTNSVRGSQGIYTVHIDGVTFEPHIVYTEDAFNTGALVLSANRQFLYAASEGMTFLGKGSGGAMAYSIGAGGKLSYLGGVPTEGQRPCSLAVDSSNQMLYAANFLGQSIAMIPINAAGELQPVQKLVCETTGLEGFMSGMHCVRVMDNDAAVGAMCVGSGEFILYDSKTGIAQNRFCFGQHTGPRHFITGQHDRIIYGLMQMPPEVHVLRREPNGNYTRIQIISAVNPGHTGLCGASEIRMTPDGAYVLAATRGNDTIAVFPVEQEGRLSAPSIVSLPGNTPRDFNISPDGRIVVTALQASDSICIHELDYQHGTLVEKYAGLHIPSPAAVEIL